MGGAAQFTIIFLCYSRKCDTYNFTNSCGSTCESLAPECQTITIL